MAGRDGDLAVSGDLHGKRGALGWGEDQLGFGCFPVPGEGS